MVNKEEVIKLLDGWNGGEIDIFLDIAEKDESGLLMMAYLEGCETKEEIKDYVINEALPPKSNSKQKSLFFEHRMRCNTCGNIFCYTDSDIKSNKTQSILAGISAIGAFASAFSGTRYDMYEQNKNLNAQTAKIKDFSRCPQCNSTNITEITDNESSTQKETPQTSISSADELKKFKELLDSGVITQEEFDAKKKQLLGL